MDNNDNKLPKGMFFKPPREGAPDFVKGSISIKKNEFFEWMKTQPQDSEWINLDMKVAKSTGKIYLSVNDWKPNQQGQQPAQQASPFSSSSSQPQQSQQQQPPQSAGFDNTNFDNPNSEETPF
jgi:hypothetical protein